MECVRSKSVGYVDARRTMTEHCIEKEPLGGGLFCEGVRSLARTRKLLPRLKAITGAGLNMVWQRWDEVKMLMYLRMMDDMERRAVLYVSMNDGMHSDLSVVLVIALLGKSASFRVISVLLIQFSHRFTIFQIKQQGYSNLKLNSHIAIFLDSPWMQKHKKTSNKVISLLKG